MANIYFDMCVNDDNGYGQHTGRLRAANFHRPGDLDDHLWLACRWLNDQRATTCYPVGKDRVRVGRRIFPILGYRCYVGNIMWDTALVTADVAGQIADYLRSTGKYDPESGLVKYWRAWDSGAPIVFG